MSAHLQHMPFSFVHHRKQLHPPVVRYWHFKRGNVDIAVVWQLQSGLWVAKRRVGASRWEPSTNLRSAAEAFSFAGMRTARDRDVNQPAGRQIEPLGVKIERVIRNES